PHTQPAAPHPTIPRPPPPTPPAPAGPPPLPARVRAPGRRPLRPAPPRAAAPAAIGPAQSCDPISCILSVHPLSLNSRWPAVYPILTQWDSRTPQIRRTGGGVDASGSYSDNVGFGPWGDSPAVGQRYSIHFRRRS